MDYLQEIGGICIAAIGIGLMIGGAQAGESWAPYVGGALFFVGMRMFIIALIHEDKDN